MVQRHFPLESHSAQSTGGGKEGELCRTTLCCIDLMSALQKMGLWLTEFLCKGRITRENNDTGGEATFCSTVGSKVPPVSSVPPFLNCGNTSTRPSSDQEPDWSLNRIQGAAIGLIKLLLSILFHLIPATPSPI